MKCYIIKISDPENPLKDELGNIIIVEHTSEVALHENMKIGLDIFKLKPI